MAGHGTGTLVDPPNRTATTDHLGGSTTWVLKLNWTPPSSWPLLRSPRSFQSTGQLGTLRRDERLLPTARVQTGPQGYRGPNAAWSHRGPNSLPEPSQPAVRAVVDHGPRCLGSSSAWPPKRRCGRRRPRPPRTAAAGARAPQGRSQVPNGKSGEVRFCTIRMACIYIYIYISEV